MKTPIYTGIFQSDLDASGYKLIGLPTPTVSSDAATKGYVDAHSGGGGGAGGGITVTNIKDAPYSAAGDGVTNDTLALQAAIDDLSALGGGRIYFPPGTYLISGPLRDTSVRNAQILLPIVGQTSPPVTIELVGALAPPTQYYYNETILNTAYSIIKSTLTGGSGTASFIASKESGGDWWSNVQLIVRDLVFEAPPNPSFTAFNCFSTMGPQFEHVLIYTGSLYLNTVAQPTHTNAVAIKLAPSSHSAGQRISGADVWGFYTGLVDGELAENHINIWGCVQGVLVPFNYHLSTYRHLGLFHCAYGIKAAGVGYSGISGDDGTHYLRVIGCALEHANTGGGFGQAWQNQVYDVDDASNLLKGDLKWLSILAGVGNHHSFIKNGGTGLFTSEIGDSTVYIGSDARLVAISGGAKLQARNTGTNTWADADQWTNP